MNIDTFHVSFRILITAHCLYIDIKDYIVRVGANSTGGNSGLLYEIDEYFRHEGH